MIKIKRKLRGIVKFYLKLLQYYQYDWLLANTIFLRIVVLFYTVRKRYQADDNYQPSFPNIFSPWISYACDKVISDRRRLGQRNIRSGRSPLITRLHKYNSIIIKVFNSIIIKIFDSIIIKIFTNTLNPQ